MILGFDFLGFQAIKHFPTKNRIFLHVMQCTITNNSFLLVCTRVLPVCYWYASRMYSYIARMYSYVLVYTRMYSYVARMYSCGVLVTIFGIFILGIQQTVTKTPPEYIRVHTDNIQVHTNTYR